MRRWSNHGPMKPLLLTLLAALTLDLKSIAQEFLPLEIPWGQGVRLAEFGGPDLEVCMRTREMTHVVAEIVDYTRLVPVARANLQGFVDTKMVPMKTTVRVEKKGGTTFKGRHEMYLVFREPETGIAVYFLDSIARQNHDNVVVVLPKAEPPTDKQFLSNPNAASPLIPELVDWHRRLLDERRTLDTTDAVAVARFNQHAADYHSALEKTRAAREALKGAPGQGTR
jgi:hypothetical protein